MPHLFLPQDKVIQIRSALATLPVLPDNLDPALRTRVSEFLDTFRQLLSNEDARAQAVRSYEPRSRRECLTRHVPPAIGPGDPALATSLNHPSTRGSTNLAAAFRSHPHLRNRARGIELRVDLTIVDHLSEHLCGSLPQDNDAMAEQFIAKWQGLTRFLEEAVSKAELHYEADQMGVARLFLAEMTNKYDNDPANWTIPPLRVPLWGIARQEPQKALTDWVCQVDSLVVAFLEGKRAAVLETRIIKSGLDIIRSAARITPARLYVKKPGGTSWTIASTNRLLNAATYKALRLALFQHHKYRVRWGILSNFDSMICSHLSAEYTLSLSETIVRQAGRLYETFTPIACMTALARRPAILPSSVDDSSAFANSDSICSQLRSRMAATVSPAIALTDDASMATMSEGSGVARHGQSTNPSASQSLGLETDEDSAGAEMDLDGMSEDLSDTDYESEPSDAGQDWSDSSSPGPSSPPDSNATKDVRLDPDLAKSVQEQLLRELQPVLLDRSTSDVRVEELIKGAPDLDLVISGRLGQGATWTVYHGSLWQNRRKGGPVAIAVNVSALPGVQNSGLSESRSTAGSNSSSADETAYSVPVAVKVCCPQQRTAERDFMDYDRNDERTPTQEDTLLGIDSELAVFKQADKAPLDALVKVHAALRIHRHGLVHYVLVTDLCGPPVVRPERLRVSDKLQIVDLYAQIHSANIIHGDVEPRHIRYRQLPGQTPLANKPRFVLIDFDHGVIQATSEAIEEERQAVSDILELADDVW